MNELQLWNDALKYLFPFSYPDVMKGTRKYIPIDYYDPLNRQMLTLDRCEWDALLKYIKHPCILECFEPQKIFEELPQLITIRVLYS